MPMYCYKCDKCGFEWEDMSTVDERYEIECPDCGHEEAVIIPSLTSFILKGDWQN